MFFSLFFTVEVARQCPEVVVADIVFLVDSFDAGANFGKALKFVAGIVDGLPVSPESIRVALVTFGIDLSTDINLADNDSKEKAITAINGVTTTVSQDSASGKALFMSNSYFYVYGRRGQTQMVVIITDSDPTAGRDAQEVAGWMRDTKTIMVVGIGDGATE